MRKNLKGIMIVLMLVATFIPFLNVHADEYSRVQVIMNENAGNVSGTYTISGGSFDGTTNYNSAMSDFFTIGTQITLNVTPDEYNTFKGWYNCEEYDISGDNNLGIMGWRTLGAALSTNNEYTFTVTESYYNIMPVFENKAGHNNIWVAGDGEIAVYYENRDEEQTRLDGEHWSTGEVVDYWKGDSITVKARANEGYHFVGWFITDPEASVPENYVREPIVSTNAEYTYQPGITTITGVDEPINYITAVFESDNPTRVPLQFQVWHTDGGKTAIQYTIDEPNPYNIPSREELDFEPAVGTIYYGVDATVTARADSGYRFVGWKHVDIEYEKDSVDHPDICIGDFIATTTSYTYKPGVTILPGDTEELRYICAVFESNGPKTDLSDYFVYGVVDKTYNGKAQTLNIRVSDGVKDLILGEDYTVTYKHNVNVGTADVIIDGIGNYKGSIMKPFKIVKANNPLSVTTKTKTVKYTKVKKKKQVVTAITVTKNQGTVTYAKLKGSSSKLTINKTTGKITVKKGTKKGTYKIKVKITAKGNNNYKAKSIIKTIKVKVK